jgi:hypothetical protein
MMQDGPVREHRLGWCSQQSTPAVQAVHQGYAAEHVGYGSLRGVPALHRCRIRCRQQERAMIDCESALHRFGHPCNMPCDAAPPRAAGMKTDHGVKSTPDS